MATSIRLPDVLKARAARYAAETGISVNALVAIALRDYLDRRPVRDPEPGQVLSPPFTPALAPAPVGVSSVVPGVGVLPSHLNRAERRKRR